MLKKILIAIVIIGAVAVAIIGYGTYKIADEALKEQEPALRQYIQMTEQVQNAYVLEHAKDLISQALLDSTPEEKAEFEIADKTKDDPVVQKALIDLGRSVMAIGIMHSDAIVKDLNADVKAKYQKEADEIKTRVEKYGQVVEDAKQKLKSAK